MKLSIKVHVKVFCVFIYDRTNISMVNYSKKNYLTATKDKV